MKETQSTCPYCGVGCGVIIESQGQHITGVRGDPDHPANFGRLCTKGSTLHLTAAPLLQQQTRLLQPLRRAQRGGELQATPWDAALAEVAERFAMTIESSGPDSVGLYLSGQLLTEDYYVFNKLGKGLIGTNNVDTNSRLCMSSAVAGYKASLGADAVPTCYDDIGLAQTVFITGSNMAWTHPVLFRRLEDARSAQPGMRVIVADPRRTETAEQADLHLALLPGTDVVLHHALLHVMLWEDWIDRAYIDAHTSGFAALRDRVREFTPAHAAKVCGLKTDDIVQAARWFAGFTESGNVSHDPKQRTPTLSLYCQGLNQSSSGTDKNSTLINLHLAAGQIGKPGAGPFSLTGQPNAMGGREVGALANQISAHRDMAKAEHRAEVAALWGVREVPSQPGKSAVEMFQAAADGQIKALWIVCTNPAQSMPDQATVRRALERCEFVVLQEAFKGTATAAYADLILPASTWGEKSGTVTNSERRISRVRAALPALGESRADWLIATQVAQRLEKRLPLRRPPALARQSMFNFADVEAVWNEHRESTRGRDCDITGLSYTKLRQPQQWPFPSSAQANHGGQHRLYTNGVFATPSGRANFVAPAWRPTAEQRDARFPVSLTTGRLRDQWHGMSRTGTLGRLFAHTGEPCVEMHPQELARKHWRAGDLVRVSSRRGELVLPVQASSAVPLAQAFVAMHWGSEFLAGEGVNALTNSSFCPQSKQPELKHTAVRVERLALPWQLVAAAWLPQATWFNTRQKLSALMPRFVYASCTPFGQEGREQDDRVGLLFRAAAKSAVDVDLLAKVLHELGLNEGLNEGLNKIEALRYNDPRAGQQRAMRLAADGSLRAFALAGNATAQAWVLDLLQQRLPAAAFGRALLAASATAPQAISPRSPQVCACLDVSEERIVQALTAAEGPPDARLLVLQRQLRCGTQCGSCLAALKTLVKRTAKPLEVM